MSGVRVIAEQVSRSYGPVEILHQVSFTVEPGEMVAVTGPSGSGKTTLLQLIGALDRPTSGRMIVGDTDIGTLQKAALFRRHTVGFVFQLHHLLPTLTAAQNVELPLAAAHVHRREREQRVHELLVEVGLGDRGGSFPSELSGGERQRIAIARALVNEPPLVIADEPTGALDSVASMRIWDLLCQVRERRGATVIFASHSELLTEHADRVIGMLDGRIVEGGDGNPIGGDDDGGAFALERAGWKEHERRPSDGLGDAA